jgi:hypothetical protein
MIEMGKKYQTRDGRAVRILCVDGPDSRWPVVGFIENCTATLNWSFDGYACREGTPHEYDLIPVPTKHEGFIVVGKDGFVWGQNVVSTIGEAIESGFQKEEGDHIVRITWED